jgi:hypothetical protein
MNRSAIAVAAILLLSSFAFAEVAAETKTFRSDNAVVHYSGISDDYAKALDRVAESARAAAIDTFGFDIPESLSIEVAIGAETRLFTDGAGFMSLTIRSEKDLRRPAESGVFNIYGICHEIGHMAMYRPIPDRLWMTDDASQGWADYLGSRLVDIVNDREGETLWPDRYNYRADGTARLKKNIADPKADAMYKAAALWMELADIVGDKGLAPIFAAWGKATVDPADPGAALRKALLAANSDKRLSDWWNKAESVIVQRRPKSSVPEKTAESKDVSAEATELANDDGASVAMKSFAGSGHAVRFKAPAANLYLTAVKIYGNRYGYPQAPAENFHVWLCDESGKSISDFPFPYSSFERGDPTWVTLTTKPTKVPPKFIICVGFNPTQTKGVMVHYAKKASGSSLMGLPGRPLSPFTAGEWMIRAEVRPATAAE